MKSREIDVYDDETGSYLFTVEVDDPINEGYAEGEYDETDEPEFAILDKNGNPLSFPFRKKKNPIGFRMR